MRRLQGRGSLAVALLLLAAGLVGCGDVRLPEAPSSAALTTGHVAVDQQGSTVVTVDPASVSFVVDASGSLVAHLRVRSAAAGSTTVSIRGSLFDAAHRLVGDVTGGSIDVAPGGTPAITLTGPAPGGTIASATFEASVLPSPT